MISTDASNPSVTVLPALGESLYLRWRKKAEISADRVSVLASRDFRSTATSLLKATFGLSERNLNLDIEALVNQVDEIRGKPELMEEVFASHPLLPIRLKAVELFSRSAKAARAGYPVEGEPIGDDALEDAVDELVKLTRRYPVQPLHLAIMRTVALGGAQLLAADRDVSDEEVKILVQILHKWFTDEPEAEILTDRAAIAAKLPDVVETVRKDGSLDDKVFILSRLTDVALADGALMDAESTIILEMAKQLEVPQQGRLFGHRRIGAVDRVPDGREAEPDGGRHPPVDEDGTEGRPSAEEDAASTHTSIRLTTVSTDFSIHSSGTHSFFPWKFIDPLKRLGVGSPMKDRREPSVPPRTGSRSGVRPARRMASSAYSTARGSASSLNFMFR